MPHEVNGDPGFRGGRVYWDVTPYLYDKVVSCMWKVIVISCLKSFLRGKSSAKLHARNIYAFVERIYLKYFIFIDMHWLLFWLKRGWGLIEYFFSSVYIICVFPALHQGCKYVGIKHLDLQIQTTLSHICLTFNLF